MAAVRLLRAFWESLSASMVFLRASEISAMFAPMYSMADSGPFSTDMSDPMSTITFLLDVTLTVMKELAPTGTMISSPSFASLNALSASEAMVTSSRDTRSTWTWRERDSTLCLYDSATEIAWRSSASSTFTHRSGTSRCGW